MFVLAARRLREFKERRRGAEQLRLLGVLGADEQDQEFKVQELVE